MPLYLSIQNITKTYGLHAVLNGVSFVLNAGERLGLVGANGVGKSTLLKIVVGQVEPDSGTVLAPAGIEIGYLAQAIAAPGDRTIDGLIADSAAGLKRLEERMRSLEQAMTAAGDDLDRVLAEYGEVSDQFERRGGYDLDHRIDEVLAGLGIAHLGRQRLFASLSGGEKARVGLAILLLQAPDVLLLDEPTNHLDAASLDWLEGYLRAYRGGLLIVSHDRHFLNQTVSTIVEIDEHTRQAKSYAGNYDAFLRAKQQERQQWEADYQRQQDEIRALRIEIREGARGNSNYRAHRDNDKFVRNIKKATHDNTVSKRIRVAEEKLKRLEANPIPEPPDPLRFAPDFDPRLLKGRAPLYASGITKTYGQRTILDGVGFSLTPRSRVALVGPNGAGKSTLLRILAGVERPDRGEVVVNGAVSIGYLDQESSRFDLNQTVFEAYMDGLDGTAQQWKATLLKSGLFRYAEFDKRVGELSSGQRRKLQIARLIAERANLLLLDEPTNDISFDVLEALEAALASFPGPIIAVSHDRRFLERFGGDLWMLEDGQLIQPQIGEANVQAVLETVAAGPDA